MKTMEKILDRTMRILSILIAFMLAGIVVIICTQTFFRYVVFRSISWSEEVTRFLFAMLVAWGLCIGIKNDALIRVDIIDHHFSPRAMKVFEIFYALSGVFVCAVLAIFSKTQIDLGWTRKSDALQISLAWIYIAMEAGYIMALLTAILKTAEKVLSCVKFWKSLPAKGGNV